MNKSRSKTYRNLMITYAFYVIFWIVLVSILRDLIRSETVIGLTPLIPLNDVLIELALLFTLIIPLSGIFGVVIGGYLLSPIILYLHKKLSGKKWEYGIQPGRIGKRRRLFTRGFFAILMAINLSSLFLTPEIVTRVLTNDITTRITAADTIRTFLDYMAENVLLMITFGLAILFFAAVWFLKDSGIIFTNKKVNSSVNDPITVKSIGDWLYTILKSYAGIGAIFTYILLIYDFIAHLGEGVGFPGNIFNLISMILWLGLPFYLTFATIPSLILVDITEQSRIRYIQKISKKLGIQNEARVSVKLNSMEFD
jgi:hypothetical protein